VKRRRGDILDIPSKVSEQMAIENDENPSRNLNLISREINFEVFQPA